MAPNLSLLLAYSPSSSPLLSSHRNDPAAQFNFAKLHARRIYYGGKSAKKGDHFLVKHRPRHNVIQFELQG